MTTDNGQQPDAALPHEAVPTMDEFGLPVRPPLNARDYLLFSISLICVAVSAGLAIPLYVHHRDSHFWYLGALGGLSPVAAKIAMRVQPEELGTAVKYLWRIAFLVGGLATITWFGPGTTLY